MFIDEIKEEFGVNKPIFTCEILEKYKNYTKAYVFRLIKKAIDNKELIKFSNGVYYIPTMTELGPSTISPYDVIEKKYLSFKGDTIGILGGQTLLNRLNISDQVPQKIEVVTNNAADICRNIKLDGRKFIIYKSRTKITKENYPAYAILEVFNNLNSNILEKDAIEAIKEYIKFYNIKREDIDSLIKFFPAKAAKNFYSAGVI